MDPNQVFQLIQNLRGVCGKTDVGDIVGLLTGLISNSEHIKIHIPANPDRDLVETADDGGDKYQHRRIRRIKTGIELEFGTKLQIPLGTWKLGLVPTEQNGTGLLIPIHIICYADHNNEFAAVEISPAWFELEADPTQLIPADLYTEPHIYLEPLVSDPPSTVRLLGPACTITLAGSALDDFDIEATGGSGGSDSEFPSARFDPPQFIIGRKDDKTKIGITCSEVLLDFKRDANPSVLPDSFDPSWRGIILKQLGVFIGDGSQVGSWSGMAMMKNFCIGFDGTDLSGTFIAELVHNVAIAPEVEFYANYRDANNQLQEMKATPDGKFNFDGPSKDKDVLRVRLEARPKWKSAGFKVKWTLPDNISQDTKDGLEQLELGWIDVPQGSDGYKVTFEISDDRVQSKSIELTLTVRERPAAGDPKLKVHFQGVANGGTETPASASNRLHLTMRPEKTATLKALIFGEPSDGSTGDLTATIVVKDGFSIDDQEHHPASQDLKKRDTSRFYEEATWTVKAPSLEGTKPKYSVLVCEVKKKDSSDILASPRLRVTLESEPTGDRRFKLASAGDWLSDAGRAESLIELSSGLKASTDVKWSLDSETVGESIFSDESKDNHFFADGTSTPQYQVEPVPLITFKGNEKEGAVKGVISTYLDRRGRLWRLTGKLPAQGSKPEIVQRQYFVTLPQGFPTTHPKKNLPALQHDEQPFRHGVFILGHVEVELMHSELTRAQVRLKLDLDSRRIQDKGELPPNYTQTQLDGLTTFFLEMKHNPDPRPDQPEYSWEADVLAEPGAADGLVPLKQETSSYVGPPLLGIPAATTLSGGEIGYKAFLLAVAVAEAFQLIGLKVTRVTFTGFRFRLLHGNLPSPKMRFAVDYTLKYTVDIDLKKWNLPGIDLKTDASKPIEMKFRNVGFEVQPDPFDVMFFYDPSDGFQLNINDPGVFHLGDGIGRLLNVNNFRTGAGNSPLWFEVELGFTLDTSIFSIDTLRIRVSLEMDKLPAPAGSGTDLTVDDFDVKINKLGVKLSVPGVLAGRGMLGIIASGPDTGETTIEGELDVKIVPLGIRAAAGMKYQQVDDVRALFANIGVEFSPGIAVGSTGAAIFGFQGLVGANMQRKPLSGETLEPDPWTWFTNDPAGDVTAVSKWAAAQGNWAFGVGTVIGTICDNAFLFNTKGAFILEIPGPKFILATSTRFIEQRPATLGPDMGKFLTIATLDLENHLLQLGIDITYDKYKKLVTFHAPAEAFFNLADAKDWHIRFGDWAPSSKRIRLRFFDCFNAWGYFDLEGNGKTLPDGRELHGVCVATGARFEVFWGSKSWGLYLEAYVEYHVGLQLSPVLVHGVLKVGGEIHLIVVSIGASGQLEITAPDPFVLKGQVCGELDLWLFSIKKCVGFTFGDEDAQIPDPACPLKELAIIDRMTSAALNTAPYAQSDTEPTVIPDVPLDAALHLVFDQDIIDTCETPAINVADVGKPRNQVSTDLFYDYYLEEIKIQKDGIDVDFTPTDLNTLFQKAWAPYTINAPESGASASDERPADQADSARTLRLLDWVPCAHDRAVDFSGGYGVTWSDLISRLCEQPPTPQTCCATFDEEEEGIRGSWVLDDTEFAPVWVINSHPDGLGSEHLADERGCEDARVVPRILIEYDGQKAQQRCLRLPRPCVATQNQPLEDVIPQLSGLFDFDGDVSQSTISLDNLLVISLPDVVTAEIAIATYSKMECYAVFLDASYKPVSAILNLMDLPGVPVSYTSEPIPYLDTVKKFSFSGLPDDIAGGSPVRACWAVINVPPDPEAEGGLDGYLMEICGVLYSDWDRWNNQRLSKEQAIETLQSMSYVTGGVPAASAQELLDSASTYIVSGTINWSRYKTASSDTNDGQGTFPFAFSFATTAKCPDDISTYVAAHDPPNDAQPLYYTEPLSIKFASDVIDKLFAKFEMGLVVRAKAHVGGAAQNQPMSAGTTLEYFPLDSFESVTVSTLTELSESCVSGDWPALFYKLVWTAGFDLKENTGYTVALIPRPLNELTSSSWTSEAWNKALQSDFDNNLDVYRFDIRTSRWASFTDHVNAYKQADVGDIVIDEDVDMAQVLDGIAETVTFSDEAIDLLCSALFGGPVTLPTAPHVHRIWERRAASSGVPLFTCCGLLIDGPEPLLKLRSDGTERAQLTAQAIPAIDATFESGTPFERVWIVAGKSRARIFVLFESTTVPPAVAVRLVDEPVLGNGQFVEDIAVSAGTVPESYADGGA
jgi:hypothetical protein